MFKKIMWRWLSFGSLLALVAGCEGAVDDPTASSGSELVDDLRGAPEHIQYQKGNTGGHHTPSASLMTQHGGAVLNASTTFAIWWGPQWSNPAFAGDKVTGMETFFKGFGGSHYAGASTEYSGTNGLVGTASNFAGSMFDTTSAPSRAITSTQAVAEACKMIGNNPQPNDIYFIYTATGAGHVSYCAWHSFGNCSNGLPIQVAYMPNIDGIAGCDPGDTWTTHSQGLGALANVTAHELSETMTDPRNGGWYDSSGNENGDKCAWSFTGPVSLSYTDPVTSTLVSSTWKLQMEWSNAAYTAGTGALNRSGEAGCLQGQ